MSDRLQNVTCRPSEFRVQEQHVNRELDFIDDALTGWLHLAPKFEVFNRVVKTVAVFVVNVFVREKLSAQRFGHDNPVMKNFFAPAQMNAPVATRMHEPVLVNGAPRAPYVATFGAAKFLARIIAGVAAVLGAAHSAFFGFATQLALKGGRGFLVHGAQLLPFDALVKEFE